MLIESQGKVEKNQGKFREKSGKSVSKIWQTPFHSDVINQALKKHCQIVKNFLKVSLIPLIEIKSSYVSNEGRSKFSC